MCTAVRCSFGTKNGDELYEVQFLPKISVFVTCVFVMSDIGGVPTPWNHNFLDTYHKFCVFV